MEQLEVSVPGCGFEFSAKCLASDCQVDASLWALLPGIHSGSECGFCARIIRLLRATRATNKRISICGDDGALEEGGQQDTSREAERSVDTGYGGYTGKYRSTLLALRSCLFRTCWYT